MAKKELLPVGNVHNFATDISIINNEIVLKGNSVFDGYLNYNNDFSYKKDNTNCFRTGDLGYIDGKYLYCKGRMDSQIKYKGYRIELMDIEYNIKSINNIQDCVVIPIYDKNNNVKKITAYVVANGISEKEIINKLSLLIPNYMIPKTFVFLDKLPINNNQKIDRKMLIKDDRYSKVVI